MVAALCEGSEAPTRRSLVALCRRYWVPVYAYVRRCGHSPDAAALLVQQFLSDFVTRLRAGAPRAPNGFRAYLEAQLQEFLADDRRERSSAELVPEMEAPWPLEVMERRQADSRSRSLSPSQALQRAFALELLATALERLRRETEENARGDLFEAVRPFLTRDPAHTDYTSLAERMRSSPLAAVIAVKRLRQRFQELVDEELAQTVGGAESLAGERNTLWSVVGLRSAD